MFSESSFVLKPSSMRLQLNPSISQDIAALYPAVEKLPIPLISNFAQYSYNLVVLAYYNNPKLVLTNVNGNLVMANRLTPVNINQTFVAIPSKLPSNAGSIHLAMPNDYNRVVGINSSDITISPIGIDKKGLVVECKIEESNFNHPDLENKIIETVKKFKFGEAKEEWKGRYIIEF